MIFNGRIFHETVKGIVNKKLYLDINDRIFRDAIQEFLLNIKEYAQRYIWNERYALNRWVGYIVESGDRFDMVNDLTDLWNHSNIVTFRSSRYASNYSLLD
ncbi:hypothetical protein RhiirA4_485259 [Rhizophagus irregularis]|uniref:Uncharacterized protein n=1 Tax=Rhizophagus irregularis TaxID=588596 RepID=A0A2I1HPX6_9GLOM|nr:hypothetical protein RhiirA4_485259 [Rhizophagus irregularis]